MIRREKQVCTSSAGKRRRQGHSSLFETQGAVLCGFRGRKTVERLLVKSHGGQETVSYLLQREIKFFVICLQHFVAAEVYFFLLLGLDWRGLSYSLRLCTVLSVSTFILRKDRFQLLLNVQANHLVQLFQRVFRLVGRREGRG